VPVLVRISPRSLVGRHPDRLPVWSGAHRTPHRITPAHALMLCARRRTA